MIKKEEDYDLILIISNNFYAMLDEIGSKGGAEAIAKNVEKTLKDKETGALKDISALFDKKRAKLELRIVRRGTADRQGFMRVDKETEKEIYKITCR